MSEGRSRGLVFFVLIALVAGLGGLGVWQLRKHGRSPADSDDTAAGDGAGAPGRRLVKGTGTTWREEDAVRDSSGVIEGLVLDADGKPVDGAQVTLGRARGRGEDTVTSTYWLPKGLATSAGGGHFRIDHLVPGEYAATATREGVGPGLVRSIEVKANETARVQIRLAREGLVLSGRVLDVGGGGISGARLSVFTRSVGGAGRAPTFFFTRSNSEGQYRLLLPRGPLSIRAEADGYAPLTDSEVLLLRPLTRDLRLVPGGRLAGRVIDRATRQPIADAEVSVTSALRMDFREPRDARTDGDGRFQFDGLEPGNFEVMARKGMQIGTSDVVALAVAGAATDVVVPVDRGYVVSGRVKSEADGRALADIRVSASRDTPPFGQAARTRSNPDGTFALEGMLPGSYRLNAYEEGFGFSGARARVISADVGNVELLLPSAVKVTGRVTSADGKPVEGATVQARIESRRSGGMSVGGDSSGTDADGRFELRRVTGGTSLQLSAQHDQQGAASVGPIEIKTGEPKVIDLTLKKGASISGVVRTEDGRPAANVRVGVTIRSPAMIVAGGRPDLTGPDGRYRLDNLNPGRVTVSAARSGRAEFDPTDDKPNRKTFELAAGEERTGVDLVVGPAGLAIRGTVQSPDGKPVPGAVVTASPEWNGRAFRGGSRELRAYGQMDGQFTLEDLNKETYTLWASHPEYPEAELKGAVAGGAPVRLSFPPDTSVAGRVTTSDGKPAPHYAVMVLPGPKPDETPEQKRRRTMDTFDARSQRVQSPDGSFELRHLAGGTHELQVSAASGETGSQVVTVQAGERKTGVEIQLQAALRVTGRLVEHGTGKPIPGSSVSVTGRGEARAEVDVGPDGSFVVDGAPVAETVRVSARADMNRYVPEFKEVEVKPGQRQVDAGTIHLLPGNMRDRMMGDRSERGDLGANIGIDSGKVTVRGLRGDGALARAGVKKGDLVTSINGVSTAQLGNGAISYLSTGKPGSTITFIVESPGAPARSVPVTLDTFKPPAPRSN